MSDEALAGFIQALLVRNSFSRLHADPPLSSRSPRRRPRRPRPRARPGTAGARPPRPKAPAAPGRRLVPLPVRGRRRRQSAPRPERKDEGGARALGPTRDTRGRGPAQGRDAGTRRGRSRRRGRPVRHAGGADLAVTTATQTKTAEAHVEGGLGAPLKPGAAASWARLAPPTRGFLSGRRGRCRPRPPRIRTCGTTASGSSADGFATRTPADRT